MKYLLLFILTLSFASLFAHEDAIRKPVEYKIILNFSDTTTVKEISDVTQALIDKSNWASVQAKFETGEVVIFDYIETRLIGIKINYKTKSVFVPTDVIQKLSKIKFDAFYLLWNGSSEKAFKANYFYLRFEMGSKKLYGKYPEIQLFFKRRKFKIARITARVSEIKQIRIPF